MPPLWLSHNLGIVRSTACGCVRSRMAAPGTSSSRSNSRPIPCSAPISASCCVRSPPRCSRARRRRSWISCRGRIASRRVRASRCSAVPTGGSAAWCRSGRASGVASGLLRRLRLRAADGAGGGVVVAGGYGLMMRAELVRAPLRPMYAVVRTPNRSSTPLGGRAGGRWAARWSPASISASPMMLAGSPWRPPRPTASAIAWSPTR